MEINGVGARVVVALLLHGPMTTRELTQQVGSGAGRHFWAGIAQAERLGLIQRVKLGRSVRYSLVPPSAEFKGSNADTQNESNLTGWIGNSKYIYTYPTKNDPTNLPNVTTNLPNVTTSDDPLTESNLLKVTSSDELTKRNLEVTESNLLKVTTSDEDALSALDQVIAADALPTGEYSSRADSEYVRRRKAQVSSLLSLWGEVGATIPSSASIERLLREAGNSAYFVAVVLLDMVDKGKDVQYPVGYISKAIKGRTERGEIPRLPEIERDTDEFEPMTPELLAALDRANSIGQQLWGSEDE